MHYLECNVKLVRDVDGNDPLVRRLVVVVKVELHREHKDRDLPVQDVGGPGGAHGAVIGTVVSFLQLYSQSGNLKDKLTAKENFSSKLSARFFFKAISLVRISCPIYHGHVCEREPLCR